MMPLLAADQLPSTLDSLFDRTVFNDLFWAVSPEASILDRGHVTTAAGPALYAMVNIPNGSTLADASTGRRFESKRGVLLLFKNGFLYVISNQEWPVGTKVHTGNVHDRSARLLDDLQQVVADMGFAG
jgi:hypothetical protein